MTRQNKIISALRGLTHAQQMQVLDEVKATLTNVYETKERMRIDWGSLGFGNKTK